MNFARPFLLAGILVWLCACNKDEGDPGSSQTRAQLITAKSYRLTNAEVILLGYPFSVIDSLDACMRDDLYRFHTDQTYTIQDMGDTCGTATTGTWAFLENDTKLRIITPPDTQTATILQLNAATLKMKAAVAGLGETIVTFTAQ